MKNTYIIVHNLLINKLQKIDEFELELGLSLTSPEANLNSKNRIHKFLPGDELIQSHYIHHNEVIQKLGHIGSLLIYSDVRLDSKTIKIVNGEKIKTYNIDYNESIYKQFNQHIGDFFVECGFIPNNKESVQTETQTIKNTVIDDNSEYVIPEIVDNVEIGIDENIERPIVTVDDIALAKSKIQSEYDKIKNIPLSEMTPTQRVIYARGRN